MGETRVDFQQVLEDPRDAPTRREFVTRAASAAFGTWLCPPLTALLTAQRAATTRDVPWLHDVLAPPADAPAPSRPLGPVLVDRNGRAITTLGEWRQRKTELERAWRDLLGPLDVERRRPPRVEVVEEARVGDVVRQRVRYLVEPDAQTEAYVLSPQKPRGRCPGAIVFHTTTPESIRQPAGLADVDEKHFGLALARRGFVAFCPRNFLWPDTTRMAAEDETRRFQRLNVSADLV